MDCEFSESQFLFGVLREITHKLNPSNGWTAPILPTLAKEKDLGFDCELKSNVRSIFFSLKSHKN